MHGLSPYESMTCIDMTCRRGGRQQPHPLPILHFVPIKHHPAAILDSDCVRPGAVHIKNVFPYTLRRKTCPGGLMPLGGCTSWWMLHLLRCWDSACKTLPLWEATQNRKTKWLPQQTSKAISKSSISTSATHLLHLSSIWLKRSHLAVWFSHVPTLMCTSIHDSSYILPPRWCLCIEHNTMCYLWDSDDHRSEMRAHTAELATTSCYHAQSPHHEPVIREQVCRDLARLDQDICRRCLHIICHKTADKAWGHLLWSGLVGVHLLTCVHLLAALMHTLWISKH